MATSGSIFWSFGQKLQNFINQKEWPTGPPQKSENSKVAKSLLGSARLGWQICGAGNNLRQSGAAEILLGPAGPAWLMCGGGKNLPQL